MNGLTDFEGIREGDRIVNLYDYAQQPLRVEQVIREGGKVVALMATREVRAERPAVWGLVAASRPPEIGSGASNETKERP